MQNFVLERDPYYALEDNTVVETMSHYVGACIVQTKLTGRYRKIETPDPLQTGVLPSHSKPGRKYARTDQRYTVHRCPNRAPSASSSLCASFTSPNTAPTNAHPNASPSANPAIPDQVVFASTAVHAGAAPLQISGSSGKAGIHAKEEWSK
ncbi:hypothetical protein EIP86_002537 [Pleurotus ostreatoroseus]|nr:hypothetical protein EIP86_002537 [Pleurotus ostreatoroseus]